MLLDTCDPEPENADGDFGKGIANAKRLLATPLPSLEQLRSSDAPLLEAASLAVEEPTNVSGMRTVAEAFSEGRVPGSVPRWPVSWTSPRPNWRPASMASAASWSSRS
jgi:hypothetical protein